MYNIVYMYIYGVIYTGFWAILVYIRGCIYTGLYIYGVLGDFGVYIIIIYIRCVIGQNYDKTLLKLLWE